MDTFNYNS